LLLRQGDGLIEPCGQMRFDFDDASPDGNHVKETLLPWLGARPPLDECVTPAEGRPVTPEASLELAAELEDAGRLAEAEEVYRTCLMSNGPHAEVSFRLAELLYRQGDAVGARERYYMAIELDEDYIEARANLGCVLAELGQFELAAAAFRGALDRHSDFPDVHYHLARLLEDQGRSSEANVHWRRFAGLAPDSPWADEARQRLGDDE
jgi:tetratricopeptide (TPR) repeat protein